MSLSVDVQHKCPLTGHVLDEYTSPFEFFEKIKRSLFKLMAAGSIEEEGEGEQVEMVFSSTMITQ